MIVNEFKIPSGGLQRCGCGIPPQVAAVQRQDAAATFPYSLLLQPAEGFEFGLELFAVAAAGVDVCNAGVCECDPSSHTTDDDCGCPSVDCASFGLTCVEDHGWTCPTG